MRAKHDEDSCWIRQDRGDGTMGARKVTVYMMQTEYRADGEQITFAIVDDINTPGRFMVVECSSGLRVVGNLQELDGTSFFVLCGFIACYTKCFEMKDKYPRVSRIAEHLKQEGV